jgi:hypothetical protein
MTAPTKRNAGIAPGGFGKAQVHRHRTEQRGQAQRAADDAFALPRRYHAIAVRPDGRRTIMCSSSDRSEVEAFVTAHRPFALSAGADLTVESDEMRVVGAPR